MYIILKFVYKISDKWCSQAGIFTNTSRSTTITLKKEYKDTNYEAMVNINHGSSTWTATTTACVESSKTTKSFIAEVYYGNTNTTGLNSWHTNGYIK